MRKRLLALTMAFCMVISLLLVTAWADEYEAAIGETNYSTLTDAINAAQPGETIKLLKNVQGPVVLSQKGAEGSPVTIDFAGFTVAYAPQDTKSGVISVTDSSVVVLTDSAVAKGGIACTYTASTSNSRYALYVASRGQVTVEGGISITTAGGAAASAGAFVTGAGSTLLIENANIRVTNGRVLGLTSNGSITVKGGTYEVTGTSPTTSSGICGGYSNDTFLATGGVFTMNKDPKRLMGLAQIADRSGKTAVFAETSEDYYTCTIQDKPTAYALWAESVSSTAYSFYLAPGSDMEFLDALAGLSRSYRYHIGESMDLPEGTSLKSGSNGTPDTFRFDIAAGCTLGGSITVENNIILQFTGDGTASVVPTMADAIKGTHTLTDQGNGLWECRLNDVELAAQAVDTLTGQVYRYDATSAASVLNLMKNTNKQYEIDLYRDLNVALSSTTITKIGSGTEVLLTLNNCTLTYSGSYAYDAISMAGSGSQLTLAGTGKIVVTGAANSAICTASASKGCEIVIGEGVTVEGNVVLLTGTNPTLDVYGEVATGNNNAAIQTNGSSTADSTINIHGGAEINSNFCAIYHPGTGILNVERGAEVTGGSVGIEMRAGTMNVYEGATITGGVGKPNSSENASGTTSRNAGIAVAQHNTENPVVVNVYGGQISGGAAVYASNPQNIPVDGTALVDVNISGGTLQATHTGTTAVYSQTYSDDGPAQVAIAVTGGTYKDSTGRKSDISGYIPTGAILTQNADGTVVTGTGTKVAEVGGVGYGTLQDAIDAAKGDTVKLVADMTVGTTLEVTKSLTINLNGHSITGSTGEYGVRAIHVKAGTLTLIGNGTITTEGDNTEENGNFNRENSVIRVGNNQGAAGLVIGENVTITAPKSYGITIFDNNPNQAFNYTYTLDVSGTVEVTRDDEYAEAAISGNGNTAAKTEITIHDGAEVSSTCNVAIYHPQKYGTLTIKGGTITGVGGIQMCAGELNVEGGTITATGSYETVGTYDGEDDGPLLDGAAISMVNRDGYGTNNEAPKAEITGGNFSAVDPDGVVQAYTWNMGGATGEGEWENPQENVEISGGTYSNSVAQFVVADKKFELNDNGEFSYYKTAEEALDAAKSSMPTVTQINGGDTGESEQVQYYKVTLVYNNGQGTSSSYAKPGTALTLPNPTHTGYNFMGWYNGTTYVGGAGSSYTVSGSVTLTARWSAINYGGGSFSSGDYLVSVDSSKNGKVTASPSRADKGDTVTITVKPDDGYELGTLTVTDKNGDSVKLTYKSANKYTFTMPGSKVTIEATFAEASEDLPFTDVAANAWYADAIQFVYENGLMTGVTTTTFGPNVTTSRAMLATILYRLEGEPRVTAASFTDVESGMYYTDAVAWASSKGIVTGYGDGTFLPNKAITREEMAAMLYRYASYKGYDVTGMKDLGGYSDAASVSSYAVEALQWATGEGLVTNMDGALNPTGSATRAQLATILMRFLGE